MCFSFENGGSVILYKISPAVHYSPDEKSGAVIAIGFTNKGNSHRNKNPSKYLN